MARRVSLEQISERLRIEPRALIALEEERFEAIGAPVFVKGYLKHYSDYLGLDSTRLLGIYRAEHGSDEPIVQARRSIESEEQRPAGGMWMAAAAAVALVAAVVWLLRDPLEDPPAQDPAAVSDTESESADPARSANPAPNAPRAASPSRAVMPAGFSGGVADDAVSAFTVEMPISDGAGDSPAFRREGEAGSAPESGTDAASVELDSSAEAASAEAESVREPQTPADPGTALQSETVETEASAAFRPPSAGEVNVALRFVEDSWAEVVDARSARLFYGLGRAGASARFNAATPVTVLFGNADGVVLEVNGAAYPYPDNSRRGRLARFTLSTPTE